MQSWESLTIAEQTLIRAALSETPLAGTIQAYGAALRWAGVPEVPPRSYTDDEQRRLVPYLAGIAESLAARGLLSVARYADRRSRGDVITSDGALQQVLADATNWIRDSESVSGYRLRATPHVRAQYSTDAYPIAAPDGLPTWEQLSTEQREVLVCAYEASGMLTGAFGIWPDPPTDLEPDERHKWVEQQLGPLLPFVRAGWIEVRHFSDDASDAYTVLPLDTLGQALADPAIRDGEEWGVGVGCVFTYRGLATWRGAWARDWNSRLHFD